MTKKIIVEMCRECVHFSFWNYGNCWKLEKSVDPNKIDPSCPLQNHTPTGVALTSDGRTMDVFAEGNEVIG
jgi:hypothetical protein